MEQKEFDQVVEETIESIKKLLVSKGAEYAGSADRLANFKRGASLTGCTPLQVLFIYMSKHYDAISTYIREGGRVAQTEPIEGRIDDLINYGILLKGLIRESKNSCESGRAVPIPQGWTVKETQEFYRRNQRAPTSNDRPPHQHST